MDLVESNETIQSIGFDRAFELELRQLLQTKIPSLHSTLIEAVGLSCGHLKCR